MKVKPYPKYKPSGIEWLGDVPVTWEVKPLKAVVSCNNETLSEDTHQDYEIQYVDISSVDAIEGVQHTEALLFKGAPSRARRRVRDGDVIVSTVRTYLKAIASITSPPDNLIVSTGFAVLRPLPDVLPSFAGRMVSSTYVIDEVIARSTGVSYPAINASDLVRIPVAIPPVSEQSAIVAFLDRETAKIDTLIAKQEKLIELLQEKRQAVISHAVTKGLDPTVPMKPSGVEWLGDVPEHWETKRLRHLSPHVTVGIVVEPSKYYCDDGVPALRSLNVRPGSISMENLVYISEDANEQLAKSKLQTGDLVAVRSGQPGTTAVIPKELDGCNCIDLIIIRKPTDMCEQFLCWYLASDVAVRQFSEGSGGAIQQHFNIGTAVNLVCTVPSLIEQRAIAAHLDEATSKIDALIAKAQQAIELQKEHRSALISAAVTGKIDVRGQVEEREAA